MTQATEEERRLAMVLPSAAVDVVVDNQRLLARHLAVVREAAQGEER